MNFIVTLKGNCENWARSKNIARSVKIRTFLFFKLCKTQNENEDSKKLKSFIQKL